MFSWLDFLKMNFTEPLILSLPTEGLILPWVIRVRGDVVILRLSHIQEAWTVLFPKRCLLPESPWLFHTQMSPSILGTFPSEGVFSMQRPEITIAAISSSHTSLYCPAAAQSTWSPWRQRCVLWISVSQGRWFLQRCSELCGGGKVPIVSCPYSCEWGWACSTWAAYLCLWWCYTASLSTAASPGLVLLCLYAPKRPRRALHRSHTHQHLSGEAGLSWQPNKENWFLDLSSPCQQPGDVLVLEAQQGTTLHQELHWQAENWVWRISKLYKVVVSTYHWRIVPGIRGVDGAAMLLYPDYPA